MEGTNTSATGGGAGGASGSSGGGSAPTSPSPATPSGVSAPSAGSPAVAPSASQTPPIAERKIPVVIDGKRVEMTRREMAEYLANDAPEDDVVSTYRLRAASQERMKAAAEQRKAAEAAIARIRDPEQMMAALVEHHQGNQGAIDAAIEKYYRQRLAESEMTPEQREAAALRAENERYKKEAEQRRQQEQVERKKAAQQKAAQEYRASFIEALEAAKLPKTPATIRRMAAIAESYLATGVKRSAAEIAGDVAAELRSEWSHLHSSLDDDALLELIGEERMQRVRARDVERFKQQQAAVVPAVTATPRSVDGKFASREATQKPTSMRDFFEKRRNG